jgi:hypothetical protein
MRHFYPKWLLLCPVVLVFAVSISWMGERLLAQNKSCGDVQKMARNSANADQPIVISITELRNNAAHYFGKTVTVDGELHRSFTDKVFTIEGGKWPDDFDVLVISTLNKADSLTPLEGSIEEDKDVRVTGVVEPYDRGNLECAYGPLGLESHEGHSFTNSPVIVIDRGSPSAPEREKPEPRSRTNPDLKP